MRILNAEKRIGRCVAREVSELNHFEMGLLSEWAGRFESDVKQCAHVVTIEWSRVVPLCPISLR